MLRFREWFQFRDDKYLTEGKKIHRIGKKGQRPDNRIDDLLDQIFGLAGDLTRASERSKQQSSDQKPIVKVSPGEEELERIAKVVLVNLKSSPEYYKRHPKFTQSGNSDSVKVSRNDAVRVAAALGVDFQDVEFSQDVFRRAIEAEFNWLRGS